MEIAVASFLAQCLMGLVALVLIYFQIVGLIGDIREIRRTKEEARIAAIEAELDHASEELKQAVLELSAALGGDRDRAIREMIVVPDHLDTPTRRP